MVIDAKLFNEFLQLYGVERKEEGTEHWSLRDTADKRILLWQKKQQKKLSHKSLLGSTRQVRREPTQKSAIEADFWVKSIEEQGMIDKVERSTKIEQNKKSIATMEEGSTQIHTSRTVFFL